MEPTPKARNAGRDSALPGSGTATGADRAGVPATGSRGGSGAAAGSVTGYVTGHAAEAGPGVARPSTGVPRQSVPAAESFPGGRQHPEPGPYAGHPQPGPYAEPGQPRAGSGPAAPRRMPRRHSVRAQILDALRSALAGGELAPGEVYSAPALAERFGVSPTPVREAMQQLASEGAVEVVPNRGFRVARRSARDLAELAEVRALLEIPVLLRMARSGTPEQWDGLRPYAAATVAAAARGDRAGYAEADRAFHHALLALSGNRQLALVGDGLHRRMQGPCGGGAAEIPAGGRTADLLAEAAEHNQLLDALAARDPAAVERLARRHLSGGGR